MTFSIADAISNGLEYARLSLQEAFDFAYGEAESEEVYPRRWYKVPKRQLAQVLDPPQFHVYYLNDDPEVDAFHYKYVYNRPVQHCVGLFTASRHSMSAGNFMLVRPVVPVAVGISLKVESKWHLNVQAQCGYGQTSLLVPLRSKMCHLVKRVRRGLILPKHMPLHITLTDTNEEMWTTSQSYMRTSVMKVISRDQERVLRHIRTRQTTLKIMFEKQRASQCSASRV